MCSTIGRLIREISNTSPDRTRSRKVRPCERETMNAGSFGEVVASAVPIIRKVVVTSVS